MAILTGARRGKGQRRGTPAATPSRLQVRHYRADATILLFGVPIYRRAGVGGGQASIEEDGAPESPRRIFFFAAGSDPRHTRGLNRLGWIREVVEGLGGAPREADYFGVMTTSPEESLAHGRKAVSGPQSAENLYGAVSGHNTAGHSRSAVAYFKFSSTSWSDERLIREAHARLGEEVPWRETSWPDSPDRAPATFLFELAGLLQQRTRHANGRYVYNEQAYTLELESAGRGPTSDHLVEVRGTVRNQRSRRQTSFVLWVEDAGSSVVPVRIQFQPRSYLRLTLEAVPA